MFFFKIVSILKCLFQTNFFKCSYDKLEDSANIATELISESRFKIAISM